MTTATRNAEDDDHRLARRARGHSRVGRRHVTAGISLLAVGLLAWSAHQAPSTRPNTHNNLPIISLPGGAASASFDIPALIPGETTSRLIDLHETSPLNLTTTASRSSLLDTDRVNGLQMQIDACNVAWTATVHGTFSCKGVEFVLASERPLIQDQIALSASPVTRGHLRVDLSLPTSADNRFQGLRSTVRWTFTSASSND
jgi:hypothetical protein